MLKEEALEMLEKHRDSLTDPCDVLHWTWLRTILLYVTEEEWRRAMQRALPALSVPGGP